MRQILWASILLALVSGAVHAQSVVVVDRELQKAWAVFEARVVRSGGKKKQLEVTSDPLRIYRGIHLIDTRVDASFVIAPVGELQLFVVREKEKRVVLSATRTGTGYLFRAPLRSVLTSSAGFGLSIGKEISYELLVSRTSMNDVFATERRALMLSAAKLALIDPASRSLERCRQLVRRLGNPKYKERKAAQIQLAAIAMYHLDELGRVAKTTQDLEVRTRVRQVLAAVPRWRGATVLARRAEKDRELEARILRASQPFLGSDLQRKAKARLKVLQRLTAEDY